MSTTHPRPRLRRDDWIDLCGEWQFRYDDDNEGLAEHWYRGHAPYDQTITVPFPPESELSGIGDPAPHPVCWYRRAVQLACDAGERLLLHFGAVDYGADLWVNGQHLLHHDGGHTPFCADITDSLDPSGHQVIDLRAEDVASDVTQPRGKQDWQRDPHVIWYRRTSGIWQPVWLERVPRTHIANVQFVPDLPTGSVAVEITLNGAPKEAVACEVALSAGGQCLARQTLHMTGQRQKTTLHLQDLENRQARGHLVWSPESPNLIDAEIRLQPGPEAAADVVHSYFGMRSCGVDDGHFLLNGQPYFVRSVLSQGFWPKSHLAAPDGDAIRREVELIKALGFNAVRCHQKVEDPRFLHWCDRLGVLVWGEMPSAYVYTPRMIGRVVAEWMEVVERDRSHPCVVTWVPLNESWGVDTIAERPDQQAFATALYALSKALDPTRPVISNDGWEHTISDILGIHDYSGIPEHLRQTYATREGVERMLAGFGPQRRRLLVSGAAGGKPVLMVTEFGGLSYHPASGQKWFGYSTVASREEYLEQLAGLFGALLDSPALSGFCYTQFTDTMQETNGLLDEDRRPKLPIEEINAIVSRPSEALRAEYLDFARRRARQRAGTSVP